MPQTGNNTTGLAVIIPLLWGPIFEKHGASLKARWTKATMGPSASADVIEVIAEQLKASPDHPKPSAWSWMFPPDAKPDLIELGLQDLFITATGVSIDDAAIQLDWVDDIPKRFGQLLKDSYPVKAIEGLIMEEAPFRKYLSEMKTAGKPDTVLMNQKTFAAYKGFVDDKPKKL